MHDIDPAIIESISIWDTISRVKDLDITGMFRDVITSVYAKNDISPGRLNVLSLEAGVIVAAEINKNAGQLKSIIEDALEINDDYQFVKKFLFTNDHVILAWKFKIFKKIIHYVMSLLDHHDMLDHHDIYDFFETFDVNGDYLIGHNFNVVDDFKEFVVRLDNKAIGFVSKNGIKKKIHERYIIEDVNESLSYIVKYRDPILAQMNVDYKKSYQGILDDGEIGPFKVIGRDHVSLDSTVYTMNAIKKMGIFVDYFKDLEPCRKYDDFLIFPLKENKNLCVLFKGISRNDYIHNHQGKLILRRP